MTATLSAIDLGPAPWAAETERPLGITVRRLIEIDGRPLADSAPALLRTVREATGCAVSVLSLTGDAGLAAASWVVEPPEAHQLVAPTDPTHVAGLLTALYPDVGAIGPVGQPLRRQIIVRPLDSLGDDGILGTIGLVTRPGATLTVDQQLCVDLIATFASSSVRRELTGARMGARVSRVLSRLSRHSEAAHVVQDSTGNGIAVALGWLDALAHDRVTPEERVRAITSVARRLEQVQGTVNQMLDTTATLLSEDLVAEPVNIADLWHRVQQRPVLVAGAGSPRVMSHAGPLAAFLEQAAPLLIPEVFAEADHVRIRVIDAARLPRESRVLLRAAHGTLSHDTAGVAATWAPAP